MMVYISQLCLKLYIHLWNISLKQ